MASRLSSSLLRSDSKKSHSEPESPSIVSELLSRIPIVSSLIEERRSHEHEQQLQARQLQLEQGEEHNKPPSRLRLLWCDSAGLRRCRVVPWHRFEGSRLIGVGLTSACMAQPVHSDCIAPNSGLNTVGEIRLVAATAPVQLPWERSHAISLADMCTPRPFDTRSSAGTPSLLPYWSGCPRAALRRALVALKEEYGLSLMCGFETEFVLTKLGTESTPVNTAQPGAALHCIDSLPYAHSRATGEAAPVLDKIVDALEEMGVPCLQYHAESGPGQFEIVTSPFEALQAADKLLLTREAIVGVASKHGLRASFVPKSSPDAAGCGCHCHLSLWKDGRSIMAATPQSIAQPHPSLSEQAASFLAGILLSLPSLLPFTAPSVNSYSRLQPDTWSGAFQAWGFDNREAPLRLTCPPLSRVPDLPTESYAGVSSLDGDVSAARYAGLNAEYKSMDGSANPYIALAAIIAAGMLGMLVKSPLPPPLQVPPGSLDPDERIKLGVHRLPSSLDEALKQLEHGGNLWMGDELNAMFATLLGPRLMHAFLAVRHAEAAHGPVSIQRLSELY